MKNLANTIYKITLGCAFIMLLFGFQCGGDYHNLYYKKKFCTDVSDVYMVTYCSLYKKDKTYFRGQVEHQERYILRYQEFPSKEKIKYHLETEILPFGSVIDSIGVYSKDSGEVLAMFYQKVFETEGKVSSTNYTNPFLEENWNVQIDDRQLSEGRWEVDVASLTFTLRKLVE